MTDNGSCTRGVARRLPRRAGLRHLRTQPYRPRTNGKAERFIRILLDDWAYAASTPTPPNDPSHPSADFYNHHRPHGCLGRQPPITRLEALSWEERAGSYI